MSNYDCFSATAEWVGGSTWGWGAMLLSGLVHVVPVVLVILGVLLVVRMFRVSSESPKGPGGVSGGLPASYGGGESVTAAVAAVEERYAQGLIDREEYRRIRGDLR